VDPSLDAVKERIDPVVSSKRFLVTGSSGFLGRAVCRRLRSYGYDVVGVVRREAREEGVVVCDLSDCHSVHTMLEAIQPDIVLHLAGGRPRDSSVEARSKTMSDNFLTTHHLLNATDANHFYRLVVVGSSEEYGAPSSLPCTEESPLQPVSPYSAAKAAATMHALMMHKYAGVSTTVVRPFIIYGPGQDESMFIPEVVSKLCRGVSVDMTDGEQKRDFVYVEDAVDHILLAATVPEAVGQVFNMCTGEPMKIVEVARMIHGLTGTSARLHVGARERRQYEVGDIYGSAERSHRVLGWRSRTSLREGLQTMISRAVVGIAFLLGVVACSDASPDRTREGEDAGAGTLQAKRAVDSAAMPALSDSILRADQLLDAGRYAEALELYASVEQSAYVLKKSGIAYLRRWDLPASINALERSRKLNDADAEVVGYLAEARTYNKQYELALDLYQQYLDLEPDNVSARTGRATALGWMKRYDEALREYTAVLKADPKFHEARMGKAQILTWQERLDDALKEYRAVISSGARSSMQATAYIRIGEILSWQKELNASVNSYQEALKIQPHNIEALMGLGKVEEWTGNMQAAKRTYEKVLKIEPGHTGAQSRLSALLWVR